LGVHAFVSGLRPFYVLAACGVAFAASYVAAVLLFRIVSEEEFELVRGKLARLRRSRASAARAADQLT
jgi:hypothetical protein